MKIMVISDIHFHLWSMFSTTNPDGVNSRLQITINEMKRAFAVAKSKGVHNVFITGDIFHRRDSIDPEVLNPIRDAFDDILADSFSVYAIPGNHDLKSDDTSALSSSIQNLSDCVYADGSFRVFNEPSILNIGDEKFVMVPWRKTTELLKKDLWELSQRKDASGFNVFAHVGIDGVLSGVPGSGFTPELIEKYGFKSFFSGHYHNHKDMSCGDTKIVSVGALTHHKWTDINTLAGFTIYDTDTKIVQFEGTFAPKFIDVSGMSEQDMELSVDGNYARFRGPQMTQAEVDELKTALSAWGAQGVSIEVPRKTDALRSTKEAESVPLSASVSSFVDTMTDVPPSVSLEEIKAESLKILDNLQSVNIHE